MSRILFALASLGVLPLALLLFAQWPLRDLVQAGSREANDLAQIIFALYMALAVPAASRAGAHLAVSRGPAAPVAPRWRAWALLACLGPWALFMLWAASGPVWTSIVQAERFADTLNPGFFLIRVALWGMVMLILVDALLALRRRPLPDLAPPHG